MKNNKSTILNFVYLPYVNQLMNLHIIRTKRKSIDVSMSPHGGYICFRVPKDTSVQEINNLIAHHSYNFIESIKNYKKLLHDKL